MELVTAESSRHRGTIHRMQSAAECSRHRCTIRGTGYSRVQQAQGYVCAVPPRALRTPFMFAFVPHVLTNGSVSCLLGPNRCRNLCSVEKSHVGSLPRIRMTLLYSLRSAATSRRDMLNSTSPSYAKIVESLTNCNVRVSYFCLRCDVPVCE